MVDDVRTGQTLAPIFIITRVIYQIVNLAGGFHRGVAHNELYDVIFDEVLIAIVGLMLACCHPAWAFGDNWVEEGWSREDDRANLPMN